MSSMIEIYNHVKGCMEWDMVSDHYDFVQEIARSGYGDMLHDHERNEKYRLGLEASIHQLRSQGRAVHVLDIGTGTGLLAMMAAQAGADSVTACEAFEPMQHCCKKVMEANGLLDKIKVVHKRSTDMTEEDLACGRATLLVTEVFDTELIGEGAVGTFRHALQHLLQPGSLVVPSRARVFAQPVSSKFLSRWALLQPPEGLRIPATHAQCRGSPALHDMQLAQLPRDPVLCPEQTGIDDATTKKVEDRLHEAVSEEVIQVFSFDFTRLDGVAESARECRQFRVTRSAVCNAVLMWWELDMDQSGDVLLSCAPPWAHPDTQQWRDHWMQAVYHFPPTPLHISNNPAVLYACHDEFSLWFYVNQPEQDKVSDSVSLDWFKGKQLLELPFCTCGLHSVLSNTRYFSLNDERKVNVLHEVALQASKKTVLYIGDVSWLPFLCIQAGAEKVFCLSSELTQARALQTLAASNDMDKQVVVICKSAESLCEKDLLGCQPSMVLAEPFNAVGLLPWHSISALYSCRTLSSLLSPSFVLKPAKVTLHALPMSFHHLWKLRAPLGTCQGFKLHAFDNLLLAACKETDPTLEPQPLWEYPGIALSTPKQLLCISYSLLCNNEQLQQQGLFSFQITGEWNGVAVWADFHFGGDLLLSTGPVKQVQSGQQVEWDAGCRQAVYFPLKRPIVSQDQALSCSALFCSSSGTLKLQFGVQNANQ